MGQFALEVGLGAGQGRRDEISEAPAVRVAFGDAATALMRVEGGEFLVNEFLRLLYSRRDRFLQSGVVYRRQSPVALLNNGAHVWPTEMANGYVVAPVVVDSVSHSFSAPR